MHPAPRENLFCAVFRGSFTSLLKWQDLDAFWQVPHKNAAAGWYVYAIGEPMPTQTFTAEQLDRFLDKIDALLRQEH